MSGSRPQAAGTPRRTSGLLRGVAAAAVSGLLAATSGCSGHSPDPSAAYFHPAGPASNITADADLVPAAASGAGALPAKGPVSRPNPALTPGGVVTTDTSTVCSQPKHVRKAVPYPLQQAVFTHYRISPYLTHHYVIDYLIPLELGGSTGLNNLWPAAVRGNGFHEKQQLTQRLRTLVCRGSLPLTKAQSGVASDWFAMWLAYAGA